MPDRVLEIAKLTCPPLFSGPRFLAVIRAFCDESYDGKSRIYTIAGFLTRDKEWASLAKRWRNRCLQEGIKCYHSTDCEGGYKEFRQLSKKQIVELNADLITEILNTQIVGLATSMVLDDYRKVSASSENAKRILGSSPYFLTMQTFLVCACGKIRDNRDTRLRRLFGRPNYRVAFIFDQQEEFSGRAKQLYDQVKKKNPNIAPCMGTLTYADRERFVPLQVADKLAYEAMKNMLNLKYDPQRKERVALTRLKAGKVVRALKYLDEQILHRIVAVQK